MLYNIIKSYKNNRFDITMQVVVDYEVEQIKVVILVYDKAIGKIKDYNYKAEQFPAALVKYRELENFIKAKEIKNYFKNA